MLSTRARVVAGVLVVAAAAAAFVWWERVRPIRWRDAERPPAPAAAALDALEAGDLERGFRSLEETLRAYDAPDWEPRVRVAAAAAALDAGRANLALDALPERLASAHPLVAHADWLRARAFLATGREEEAAVSAREAAVGGFPELEEAVRIRAAALEESGRPKEALAVLDAAPSPPLALEAARLCARTGDTAGAVSRLAAIVLAVDGGDTGERALGDLVDLERDPARRFTAQERRGIPAAARRWTGAGRPASAVDLIRAATAGGLSSRTPEEALAEAEALLRAGRADEAAAAAARAAAGDGATKDGALYLRARADLARGRGSYLAELSALSRRPGRSEWKLAALADLAEIAEGRPSRTALDRWRRYREAAGDAADPVALFREGFAAYELRLGTVADAAFARTLARDDAPAGVRAAALYWSARRLEDRGDAPGARARLEEIVGRWPNHYYAVLAERRLRRPRPKVDRGAPARATIAEAGEGGRWLAAARELRRIGRWAWASSSFRSAARGCGDEKTSRAIALEAVDGALDRAAGVDALQWTQAAVGDRDRAPIDVVPVKYWRLLLPTTRGADLEASAKREGLDPGLVAAVVLEESAFNPLAVSSVGARGLLQLMPPTGAELARSLGMRDYHADRLFDPEVNLRLGTAYLRRLERRWRIVPAALAAYNAGPARVERWLLPRDDGEGEAFTERIPIPATRIYVKRIVAARRLYDLVWFDPEDPTR